MQLWSIIVYFPEFFVTPYCNNQISFTDFGAMNFYVLLVVIVSYWYITGARTSKDTVSLDQTTVRPVPGTDTAIWVLKRFAKPNHNRSAESAFKNTIS